MPDQVQPGHEHLTPRGYVMQLSTPFVESIGADRLQAYVDAVVSTFEATRGASVDDITAELDRRLDAAGIPHGQDSGNIATQLVEAASLSIITSSGKVLYGRDPKEQAPDVQSSEDPASNARPTYS